MTEQNKILPDFKGKPEFFLPSLSIIRDCKGNWKLMKSKLVKIAKDKKSEATDENIVSAYITPGLRNLNLITGRKESIILTPDGQQCVNIFEKKGETEAKKRLGQQIIKVDEENANLISYLLKNHYSKSTSISAKRLKQELMSNNIKGAETETRVPGWISLLQYVQLLRNTEIGFHIIKSQYQSLKSGEEITSFAKFAIALKEAKIGLKYATKGSPYLPIPDLREFVCDKLGIMTFTFNKMIREFPPNYKGVKLVFATPIRKKPGGIVIGKKYYYFIGVFS